MNEASYIKKFAKLHHIIIHDKELHEQYFEAWRWNRRNDIYDNGYDKMTGKIMTGNNEWHQPQGSLII